MKKTLVFLTILLFTASLAFSVDVLTEGFEGTFPPTDWVLESATGDNWVQDDGTTHGPGSVYAGTYAAMYNNYDYSSGISGSMTTPAFDASAVVDPQVSFYWWNDDSSYNPATLEILSSTDGTTFTSIETIDVFGSGGWVEYSHSIGLDVTHIKLTATSDYGMDNTFVDEFLISGLQAGAPGFPTNPSPAIAATYVAVSGDLTWDFGADTETYDLWFGEAGAMTEVVTGSAAGASGSYAYSGLSYSSGYEWQVIAHNTAERLTTNGPVWSFTTENDPVYVQVGDGTAVNQALPIEPFYGYSYSNVIYLAAEIFASGDITGVQYQYQSTSGFGDPDDIVIWVGHTTQSEFIDGDDWIDVTTMTEVFNGQLYFPPAAGDWIQINFPVPFTYNGTDNLVIAWDENTTGYHSSSDDFYCTSTDPVVRGLIYRSDSTNPDPTAPPTATYERTYIANVRLNNIVQPFGTLDGYVYESGTTNPIENAEVTCAGESAFTDATGYYIIPVVTTGTHDATADHANYFPETVSVVITEGVTTAQNFGLEWAEIIVDPLFFDISILPDATDDQLITITNDGPHELTYNTGINFLTDGDNIPRPNYLPYNGNYPRRKDVELSAGIDMSNVPYRKSFEPSTDILRGSIAWFRGGEYATYFYGTFDTDTPGDMTEILSPPTWPAYCGDFDTVNTDFFYTNNPDDYNIYTIDCATGVETLLGPTGLADQLNGMACDKTTGIMYGCDGTTLYTIDISTGAATAVGAMGTTLMIDIAIDGSGDIWGIDIGDDNLYSVDKTTGAATVVGPTGYDANYAQGMNWDPELDIIFWGCYGGGLDGNLRIVDTSTGATTLVGDFEGGREVTVLAFPGVGETWLSITNNASGVIPGGGGSVDVTVHFDAAGLTLGTVRTAEIIINHDAVTGGPEVLPVTMTVEGGAVFPPPANVVVDPELGKVTWLPPGVVFLDDFDSYTAGEYLCTQTTDWTPWSGTPGGADDAYVSNEQANSAPNSVKIEGSASDIIHMFGDLTTGHYGVSFYFYVAAGCGGYFNLMHDFTGESRDDPRNEWAIESYFASDGTGYIHAGGQNAATFTYPAGTWFECAIDIDLDNDWAEYYVYSVFVHGWQWSLTATGSAGLNQLGVVDFFAAAPTGDTVTYFFDDFTLSELSASRDLTGYNVYLDDMITPITYTTELECLLTDYVTLVNGTEYTAGVSAVYDDPGESEIIEVEFTYGPPEVLPPENLVATVVNYNEVELVWEAPGGAIDILLDQQPNQVNGIFSDAGCDICGTGVQVVAENFSISTEETIEQIVIWDGYYSTNTPIDPDVITVIFHDDDAGLPGTTISTETNVPYIRVQTGLQLFGVDEWMHTLTLANPVTLGSGTYWVEIYNDTGFGTDDFFWETGDPDTVGNGLVGNAWATTAPGSGWNFDGAAEMAMQLIGGGGDNVASSCTKKSKVISSSKVQKKTPVNNERVTISEMRPMMISESPLKTRITHRRRTNTSYATRDDRSLAGYKVYRDGEEVYEITDPLVLTYSDDEGLDAGDYEYYVTAIYVDPAGESVPSNIEPVTITLPAPVNAAATSIPPNIMVEWDAPPMPTRDLLYYRVYRDLVMIADNQGGPFYIDQNVPTGDYIYNVTAIYTPDYESEFSNDAPVSHVVGADNNLIPIRTELTGNYPNPFNPTTTINFALNKACDITIMVYNIKGEKIRNLVDGHLEAAYHSIVWDGKDNTGRNVSSGVYFYKMKAEKYSSTKKMILMK